MNIQTLLSQLKKARKRRVILSYHARGRAGVDVKNEEWAECLNVLKQLFKEFKAAGCNILISWWGEIYIIPKGSNTAFELKLSYQSDLKFDYHFKDELKKSAFKVLSFSTPQPQLCIQIKAYRNRALWYVKPIDLVRGESAGLGMHLFHEMRVRLKRYTTPGLELHLDKITREDLLAVIHYGAALSGRNSTLYNVSRQINSRFYYGEILLTQQCVRMKGYSAGLGTEIYIRQKDMTFIRKHLSILDFEQSVIRLE